MINFIVCDDEKKFRDKITLVIDKMYMNNDSDYKIHEFTKYDDDFEEMIKNNLPSKIYILDIEMKDSISGIDIARKIREEDWNSIIIIVTSHTELGYEALKAQIMLLDFISKYNECEENLRDILTRAIEKVNEKKVIFFKANGITHRICIGDILCVEKDTVDRKCIIRTTYGDFSVGKTMNEMQKELGKGFYLSHRSCLVNLKKIKTVDWKESLIYFENDDTTNLLSREKKKGLKDYVDMV